MSIVEAGENELEALVKLGRLLWQNESDANLKITFKETFYRPSEVTFCLKDKDESVAGFAIFSIRDEYVEGADTSPTGYLEAVVIDSERRGEGLAEELVQQGIAWCKHRGCIQIGSDVEWDNEVSQAFHLKLGFREMNRLVCYIKEIT